MPECSFHPGVETNMRCANCERPICPKEMVLTPVGYKCPICAKPERSQYTYVKTPQLIRAVIVSLLAGGLGGVIVQFLLSGIGFFFLLAMYGYGMGVAELVRKASGGHRGPIMASVAAAGIVLGGVVSVLLFASFRPLLGTAIAVFGAASTLAWSWR